MGNFKIRKIDELLFEAGSINESQLKEIAVKQKKSGRRLTSILVEDNYISEQRLLEVLEDQLGISAVDLYFHKIDPKTVMSIPKTMAAHHEIIPIGWDGNRILLAMSDPMDLLAMEDVSLYISSEVEPVIASGSAINHFINRYYGFMEKEKDHEDTQQLQLKEEQSVYALQEDVDEAPVVRLVDSLIHKAVTEGASDIHIEPMEKSLRFRIRIDGFLHDFIRPPENIRDLIISRIKIMANIDIAEKRLPHDGKIKMNSGGKEINIRVSSLPTVHGEKLVLRLFQKEKIVIDIDSIGFTEKNFHYFKQFISQSYGIILLTGPTGCGKTTTLYSTLNHLNNPELNIVTVEDPVEYYLEGINQVQVHKKGLSFAESLRTILRQDPDIIMVGEMRDLETAEIGTRAALTGHLVLSTLHTNNASQALTRLIDMGVPPFLVSASLVGVIAQRLVRTICTYCREEYLPQDDEKEFYETFAPGILPQKLYHGKGCRYCREGYRGRTAIHEVLPVTSDIRNMINTGTTADILEDKTLRMGLNNLCQDGLLKATQGITTLKEIKRIAFSYV